MHTAFDFAVVLDWKQLPFQIESIETYDSTLLVGTTRGHLLVYEVRNQGESIELMDTKKSFAKKAVAQLYVAKELNLLLSLSENCIQIHDLATRTPRRMMEKSKGCLFFAADVQVRRDSKADTHRSSAGRNVPWQELVLRLAVVFKKRIVTFVWTGSDFAEQKELALPDTPKMAIWCGTSLLLGYKREYDMIEEESLSVSKVFNTGDKQPDAAVGVRIPGNEVVLVRDNISHFVDIEGRASRQFHITWSDVPLAIDVVKPYAIALLPRCLEIRTLDKGTLVQSNVDVRARFAVSESLMLVASDQACWFLKPVPLEVQLDELMAKREYEEALALSAHMNDSDPNKKTRVEGIKKAFAYAEFEKKHYKQAMDMYAEADVSPMEVIALLPFLAPDNTVPMRLTQDMVADQENAVNALIEYLTQRRAKLYRKPDSETRQRYLETIDTYLLRCYLGYKQGMIAPLLRLQPNYCNVDECEKLLKADRPADLVLLYKNRGMHRQALELLQRNAARAGPLNGIGPTVDYLQKLGPEHLDLMLDFSRWVLQNNAREALNVFIDDNAQYGQQLPRARVLEHLKSFAPQMVVPYLEHIIHTWNEVGPEFHNQLVLSYLDRVLKVGFMEPGREREQLLEFLQRSPHYLPQTMLTRFLQVDGLYEERATLLGRLGRHDKALDLYVNKLYSPAKAEAYCAAHFASDPTVYLSLLKIFLGVEGSSKNMDTAAALEVLRNHHERIDSAEALKLLPNSTKLCDVEQFLVAVLRERAVTRRDAQILRSLAKVESLQVKKDLLLLQGIRVEITDEQLCNVCRKPIKNSAFTFYPNRIIAHYHCSSDRDVCPCTNPKCTLQHNLAARQESK